MASRRIAKSAVDWSAFAARVPAEQQPMLKAFKTRHDAYVGKMTSFPENPPAIDWSLYQSKVPVAGLVEQFKKQYEAVKVSYPEDSLTKEIDAQEKNAVQATEAFVKESKGRIEKIKVDLKKWEDMLPIHKMTLEEYILEFPENAEGLDQKRYQTLYPHDYDPRSGIIPGERGSGAWNIGPDAKHEKLDAHH
ncbi:putative ATP synthase subunit d, mitochondrial [Hypsibius exemplaris]|uniref:ATP synthase subunit d, mitochondrial n=1 Tax=Hypsibius exemplaris TaxID=2072580 RepID=A0A1W0WD10_HYPEX|nr:putative ATP synthase subunit d, mitochondrial [Hypsibius exemplaris]